MAERYDRERKWRRFDEDPDFENRPGALDRRWGYGDRLAPQQDQKRQNQGRNQGRGGPGKGGQKNGAPKPSGRKSEFSYPDPYNAPRYWTNEEQLNRPGPFTGYGPRGYRRPDESIHDDVCDRLTQHAEIDASDIEVTVSEGEVTLTGTVEDRRIKRLVEANVEMIPGVVDVHNELILRRPESPEERAARKTAEELAEKFPGGPTPSGNAGY